MIKYCKCGCGKIINGINSNTKKPIKFISGHNSKMKHWNKGKYHSEDTKEKISKALKGNIAWNKGRPCSKKTRTKISVAHKNNYKNGQINPMKGKQHSKEAVEKTRQANLGRVPSMETRNKMSLARKGMIVTEETRLRLSLASCGKIKTKSHRQKLSQSRQGKTYEELMGSVKAKEVKLKKRLLHLKRIQSQIKNNQPVIPIIGNCEKEILDIIEMQTGQKIERQKRVCGYFLDGYCLETNTAFEVDEPAHQKQILKDILRENEIKEELDCSFIRIKI